MTRRARAFGPAAGLLLLAGCASYRIEYRDRPAFYASAGVELPDRETLPDGTVVVYRDRNLSGALQENADRDEEGKPFLIREKLEDGTIVLRSILPEQLLANLITCIRNEEYTLIWEQILAEQTRTAWQDEGKTAEDFIAYFRKYRHELAEAVNRMSFGLLRSEVVVDNMGDGVTRYRFHPTVAGQMTFTTIFMRSEPEGIKLLTIR
ncbi:MAG: hypothetical protein ACYTJ0_05000 [Planctomycetota bacterium]